MKQKNRRNIHLLVGAAAVALTATLTAHADLYPNTVLSQGPVGYWQLNEAVTPTAPPFYATNAGTVGPAGNGTYYSTIRGVTPGAIVSEPSSPCAQFLGVVDHNAVQIPYYTAWCPTGPFSVEFWAKPGQTATILCPAASVEFIATPTAQRNGWLFYQGDSGLATGNGWVFRQYNSTGLASQSGASFNMALDTTKWYHVVGVYNGTTITVFVNGVSGTPVTFAGTPRANTNSAIPLTFGARALGASGAYSYNGSLDECAIYNTALSAAQIQAHYAAGTNAAPATAYAQVVLGDSPAGYWRLNELGDPAAANSGSFGASARGSYYYDAAPGQAGPGPASAPVALPGFSAANKAVAFAGTNGPGTVSIPALNLNTNTVTITAWVKPTGNGPAGSGQTPGAGLVIAHGGTTAGTGLALDRSDGSQLAYHWGGVTPANSGQSGLTLPDGEWSFVAVAVQPTFATLYAVNSQFPWGSGYIPVFPTGGNVNQAFDAPLLIGSDNGVNAFTGEIDEVAVFNRTLSTGEVFTEYAAAAGGIAPQIFTDLQGPISQPYAGDPLILTIDVGGTPPLTYTWLKNGSLIPGATNSVFEITNTATTDSATYQVVVTNLLGGVSSSPVPVTIAGSTIPTIVQGPQGRAVYPGGTLSLSVVATGGGLSYQWTKNSSLIVGATTSAFSVASVVAANAGSYSVTLSNVVGVISTVPAVITVPTPIAGSYEAIIEADAPVSWWRLNEAAGSTNMWDALARNDGYYTNLTGATPPVTLGAVGALSTDPDTAASFTAASKGIGVVPLSSTLTPNSWSIECWVKTTVLSDTSLCPVSSTFATKGWWWGSYPSGYWSSLIYSGGNAYYINYTAVTGDAITSGQWSHLVMTYNGGLQVFVNGQGNGGNYGGPDINMVGPLIIGARGGDGTTMANDFFTGQIDEVAFYKTALTQTQIQNHYQGRFGSTTPPFFSTSAFLPQTLPTGSSVTYSTTVAGSTTIGVYWTKNGTAIAGATTTTLALTNLAVSDTGTYTLWATNKAGTNSLTASLTVVPPVSYANVTNGLVLHLAFDGTYADSSGKGNDASAPAGSPSFLAGEVGQAVTIATTKGANYLAIPNTSGDLTFDASTSFSVGLWLRYTTAFGDDPIIGNAVQSTYQQGWTLTEDGGHFEVSLCDTANAGNYVKDPVGGVAINDGAWHHLVAVVDRSQSLASAYVDSFLASTWSIAGLGTLEYGNALTIGQDPTGSYGAATFDLDDLGIWKRPLTASEVTKMYTAGKTGSRSFNSVAPPVTLTITPSGTSLILNYAAGTLLQSTNLGTGAVWAPVAGASAPSYTFTPGTGNRYFRVETQ